MPNKIAKKKPHKKTTIPNAGQVVQQKGLSFIAGKNVKSKATLEDWLIDFTKLNIALYDPAITILDIYPTDLQHYAHTKT